MSYNDIDTALLISAGMSRTQTTPEQRELAKRKICGSRACRDPHDAAIVLQALGLIPYKE